VVLLTLLRVIILWLGESVLPQVIATQPHRDIAQMQVEYIPPHRENIQPQVVIIPPHRGIFQ
jgi:hypothetical protein